jgi:hypothetical protein
MVMMPPFWLRRTLSHPGGGGQAGSEVVAARRIGKIAAGGLGRRMEETRIRASALAPLRNPTYRAIWLATIASNFGGLV